MVGVPPGLHGVLGLVALAVLVDHAEAAVVDEPGNGSTYVSFVASTTVTEPRDPGVEMPVEKGERREKGERGRIGEKGDKREREA